MYKANNYLYKYAYTVITSNHCVMQQISYILCSYTTQYTTYSILILTVKSSQFVVFATYCVMSM